MQSMSALALRSAGRRAAWSCSRRGLATATGDAEREKIAAMVQQEVRSQLRAEAAARAKAERESVAALVQREVRDRLREEGNLRAEAEWAAFLRRYGTEAERRASGSGLWWSKGGWVGDVGAACLGVLIGAAYGQLCLWIIKYQEPDG